MKYRFEEGVEPEHLDQIRRLNHRTFTQEIPQHASNERGVLVDPREGESTFVVALHGRRVVGMLAVADRRPFSLDDKLSDLDAHLPPVRRPCEIRLLAVEPEHRSGVVFHGLVRALARLCLRRGYDLALISGTKRQLRLYRHLGFVPFGPEVGTPQAPYQPMYLTLAALRERERVLLRGREERAPDRRAIFTPGPTERTPEIARALAEHPWSHRSPEFAALLRDVKSRLLRLTGARHVQVLLGSGTLANDAVAARLSIAMGPGIVLAHGEFGERLVDHARRWRLDAHVVRRGWGEAFEPEDVERALALRQGTRWLWAVHCETSTSVMTELPMLREVCESRNVRLCLDAMSTLGTMPLDLTEVHLATAASNKGLGAVPGLSFVFHRDPLEPSGSVPRYLDLGLFQDRDGVPFTHSWPLMAGLRAALRRLEAPASVFDATAADGLWLRRSLRERGFGLVGDVENVSPAVTTIRMPAGISSRAVGVAMEGEGYALAFRSDYLMRRNWIQVCFMGPYRRDRIAGLVERLEAVVRDMRRAAAPQARDRRGL